MAFRRDSKVDAFQRQISALRHQLGGETDDDRDVSLERSPQSLHAMGYGHEFPDLDVPISQPPSPLRDRAVADPPRRDESGLDVPPPPSIDTETSVIAHSTAWNGHLESTGSLHVYGRVEGMVTARGNIYVAEEAEIDAVIAAASVTIAGKVRGSIQCSHRFEILPRGRVSADIRAPAIVIHDGALLAGEIAMSSPESRGKMAAVPAPRVAHGGA